MSHYLRITMTLLFGTVLLSGCDILANLVPAAPATGAPGDKNPNEVVEFLPAAPPAWAYFKTGNMVCAEGKKFTIHRADVGESVEMEWLGKRYTLMHIATSTGAYRYEDKVSGIVLVQIPAKTQLLNAKLGQRLADECKPKN